MRTFQMQPATCQSAVNAPSIRSKTQSAADRRVAYVATLSCGHVSGILFAAVAKGCDNDRIDANDIKRRLTVGGVADEPLPNDRVRQRRECRSAVDAADDLPQVVDRKAITANADNSGRRSGDNDPLV